MGQVFLDNLLGMSERNLLAGTLEKKSETGPQWPLESIPLYK